MTLTRFLVSSPEPFSNWTASFAEDGLVLAGIWFALHHPIAFLAALALFMALIVWLLPKVWRGLKAVFRTLRRPPRTEPST